MTQKRYQKIVRLILDKSMSPSCRWLLSFLCLNDTQHDIRVEDICDYLKEFIDREAVDKIIDEAIASGYMARDVVFEDNLERCEYILMVENV